MTECSATCGEGVITQQRTCTQPSPSCGGRDCTGNHSNVVSCNKNQCCPGTYTYIHICISYNAGKSALPDIYAQCLRALQQVHIAISGKAHLPVLYD